MYNANGVGLAVWKSTSYFVIDTTPLAMMKILIQLSKKQLNGFKRTFINAK
jgi:peptide deformylase